MRYNASTKRIYSLKAVRAGVEATCTNLTQPTEMSGGLGWYELYQANLSRPGGIPSGHFCLTGREPGGDAQTKEVGMDTHASSAIPRKNVVAAIAALRKDWQEAAGDDSLVITLGSVGCILADLSTLFGFTQEERRTALGSKLVQELEQAGILAARVDKAGDAFEWVHESWAVSEQVLQN